MGYRKIKLDCASVCSDARSRRHGQSCHCANLLIMLILRDKNSVLILCIIVVAVFFLSRVVACTHRLMIELQGQAQDVGKDYAKIGTAKANLQRVRENVVNYHSAWWKECLEMAEKVGAEPSIPRVCIRKTVDHHASGHHFKGNRHQTEDETELGVMYSMHDSSGPGARRSTNLCGLKNVTARPIQTMGVFLELSVILVCESVHVCLRYTVDYYRIEVRRRNALDHLNRIF